MNRIDETHAFEADRAWIDAHLGALVMQYPDHWVAVKDSRVIAYDVDLGELLSKVQDLAHTCIEFINSRPTLELL